MFHSEEKIGLCHHKWAPLGEKEPIGEHLFDVLVVQQNKCEKCGALFNDFQLQPVPAN